MRKLSRVDRSYKKGFLKKVKTQVFNRTKTVSEKNLAAKRKLEKFRRLKMSQKLFFRASRHANSQSAATENKLKFFKFFEIKKVFPSTPETASHNNYVCSNFHDRRCSRRIFPAFFFRQLPWRPGRFPFSGALCTQASAS